jgi:phosphate transport system permease protein
MALPYHLYMLLTQGTSSVNAYGTAFVMMMIVLITNTLATWFAWRKQK